MDRILIFGMTENPGGVESFLMNYYRSIDRSKVQFDFLCNTHKAVAYEEELVELGGSVYHITARSEDYGKYQEELKRFFMETRGRYRAIWVNVSSLANIDYLKYAKKYGITRRIIHSHNSRNMDSFARGVLHRFNRMRIGKYATDFWACSQEAANWFYVGRTRKKAVWVRNAISVEAHRFSAEKRGAIRERLQWEDQYVIGNIGRLHFQKNQKFILAVFAELIRLAPDFRLVLIGGGEDETMLRKLADEYGINEYIFWAGVQKDIGGWLSAFDLFLFPSLFEGLSVVALEAQAGGLLSLASEGVIPEEVRVNENFHFMSLKHTAREWAEKVIEMRNGSQKRIPFAEVKQNFQRCGYDITVEAGRMERELLR